MRQLVGRTVISLVQGDITQQEVDAIVNAANNSLLGGGGVDGAIHDAGGSAILEECIAIRARQGGCPTGQAVITTGGRLPAGRVIHAVGPVWHGGGRGEPALLRSAYLRSLELAAREGLRTVAFPSISTGAYQYPLMEAAAIAIGAIVEHVTANPEAHDEVRMVLFTAIDLRAYGDVLQQRG
ncbi:O-acetyl-ADP-ribose deacetylase [Paraliomyxa miuraensis]|uniref:O-acetyl-ADP-ribose deacetylase n=1 Tax=Paraliomyxa miuraensis TaxID=376150 RepID=UPI002256E16E|nr:O-acetyl-ADP-ribose deacetylase [Paraliomyxa miuraensis]MCX4242915.1 O-acetyl-ADP-ribose deacetylase [Paraliomyxa miuraensis]